MSIELNRVKVEKVIKELKNIIHGISGMEIEAMDAEERLISYGLDSMLLLKMARQIDLSYEVEIPLDIFFTTLNTLQLVAEHIAENSIVILEEAAVVSAGHTVSDKINETKITVEAVADDREESTEVDIRGILKVFENQYYIMVKQNEVLSSFISEKDQQNMTGGNRK